MTVVPGREQRHQLVAFDLEKRQERPRWEQIAHRFYSEDESL